MAADGALPGEEAQGDPGYRGPATVVVNDVELEVELELRGNVEPMDGYFHWYGRISPNAELHRLAGGKRVEVVLRTPDAERPAELSDPDPWGRYRISGKGSPPFPRDPIEV